MTCEIERELCSSGHATSLQEGLHAHRLQAAEGGKQTKQTQVEETPSNSGYGREGKNGDCSPSRPKAQNSSQKMRVKSSFMLPLFLFHGNHRALQDVEMRQNLGS